MFNRLLFKRTLVESAGNEYRFTRIKTMITKAVTCDYLIRAQRGSTEQNFLTDSEPRTFPRLITLYRKKPHIYDDRRLFSIIIRLFATPRRLEVATIEVVEATRMLIALENKQL